MKYEINILRFISLIILIIIQINVCTSENVKKSIDNMDTGEPMEESNSESLEIAAPETESGNLTCSRRANSQMHEIRTVEDTKQFPFVGAVMSHKSEYLCAASLVSNGLLVSTASCTMQPLSFVLINTTKDKIEDGAVMLHVTKTEKFPSFSGVDSLKDVGLIYTEKLNSSVASKIRMSNYTNPRNIIDVEAIGFGLNAEVGQTKLLQYIGLEVRSIFENGDILKGYFDCVATKITTCFKDTGGPVIFDNELVGIVTKGQEDCTKEMSALYALNKKIADILPTFTFKSWLDEKIKKNEEAESESVKDKLQEYPMQPSRRLMKKNDKPSVPAKTSGSSMNFPSPLIFILYPILLSM